MFYIWVLINLQYTTLVVAVPCVGAPLFQHSNSKKTKPPNPLQPTPVGKAGGLKGLTQKGVGSLAKGGSSSSACQHVSIHWGGTLNPRVRACIGMVRSPKATLSYVYAVTLKLSDPCSPFKLHPEIRSFSYGAAARAPLSSCFSVSILRFPPAPPKLEPAADSLTPFSLLLLCVFFSLGFLAVVEYVLIARLAMLPRIGCGGPVVGLASGSSCNGWVMRQGCTVPFAPRARCQSARAIPTVNTPPLLQTIALLRQDLPSA